jgi:NDP-sugar pyrophosphorylase family protein
VFHQLRLLQAHGARRIVLCVGHLGEKIAEVVCDGSGLGVKVEYSYDGDQLAGTAGAIRQALSLLGDSFLVLHGDTYLRIDYADVAEQHRRRGLPALMTVLQNDGRWGASNAVYRDGLVVAYDKQHPSPEMRWIDYGLSALDADAIAGSDDSDLAVVFSELARRRLLGGYEATERFYEIGTPDALEETAAFLRATKR